MKPHRVVLQVVIVLLATCALAQTPIGPHDPLHRAENGPESRAKAPRFSSHTLLAQPRAQMPPGELAAAEEREGRRVRRTFSRLGGLRVLEAANGETIDEAVTRLRATGRYEFVEPDYVMTTDAVPNDPHYVAGDQWALHNTGQTNGTVGADIHAEEAWDLQTNASNVIVAIIDSGIRATHEDLAANLWVNPGETGGSNSTNLRDDDANGYIDDVNGINSIVATNAIGNGLPLDDDGHGTGVASIIGAAGNNAVGMAGIAWNVKLMALKFLDSTGSGFVSDEIECFDYAIAKGAKVINCSFGSSSFSQALLAALTRTRDAGIIVVCSAGNDTSNNDVGSHYPSGYLLDNIIAVANTTRTDSLSSSSDFGSGMVDLGAPGTSIFIASNQSDSSYDVESGTSFSAPMVSGTIALLKAKFPGDTYRQTINRLLRSVDPLPGLAGKTTTGGRLNIAAALRSTTGRPFNDDFAQRSQLSGETITGRAAAQFATREAGEPAHAGASGNGSLWWSWTSPRTGVVSIDSAGSTFDTVLGVYTGSSVGSLVSVVSNDDESATVTTSKVSFTAVSGTTYQIAVDAKTSTAGLVVLHLGLLSANDAFTSAQVVSGRSWSITADNRGATRETGEPRISNNEGGHSVWYRWVAPATRRYHIASYSNDFNSMIGVYTGSTVSTLAEVASSLGAGDANNTILDGGVTITAVAGTTYYISVDSEAPAAGAGTVGAFSLSCIDSEWEFFGRSMAAVGNLSSPAIATDGTVHFSDGNGNLYALNPDGTSKWKFAQAGGTTRSGLLLPGFGTFSAPAVAPDGTVYIGDDAKILSAVNPDGTFKWRFTSLGVVESSPAIGADGTVYVRSDDNLLYALNPADGTKKWSFTFGTGASTTYTSPTVAADGTIYCAGPDSKLYAFNPDGTVKWSYATDFIYASPALGSDGTIYFGVYTPTNKFIALRPDGTLKWSITTGDAISSSAAIGPDGTLYFGCADKNVYAVSADGQVRWTFATGDAIRNTSPLIAADGAIYIGSLDGKIYCLGPDGTLRRIFATATEIRASPLLHNGRLYIASNDFRLYAIDVGQVPAGSAWPMHRQNVRRTGRPQPQALAIGVQPQAQTAPIGAPATLTVGAVGTAPLSYQWFYNGQAIAGATGANYVVDPVVLTSAGQYSVRVNDATGAVTSTPVFLSVSGSSTGDNRLTNLATRAVVGTGGDILIPGITVAGTVPKQLLIRAAGPALTAFGVSGALARPQLRLLKGTAEIASNTGWGNVSALSTAFTQVGAFPFAANSADSAILTTVEPGSYTAQVSGVGDTTGVALVEVYEMGSGAARLFNLSCRARVGTGGDILIPGITIAGTGAKQLLIRAAGPVLTAFGVPGALAHPKLELYSGTTKVAENTGWSTAANSGQISTAATSVGAFAFAPGSADCALLITLSPGGYTVQVSGVNSTTGVALVEVYEVP